MSDRTFFELPCKLTFGLSTPTNKKPRVALRSEPTMPVTIAGIVKDERGVAYIRGTSMKVRYIVLHRISMNESAEEIQRVYPTLSLSQVRAALQYYVTNQSAIDAEIVEEDRCVAELRTQATNQITRAQLLERRDPLRTA